MRCLNNRQSASACRPKNSWLAGKVKCGRCGYALTIRKSKTKWGRYFVCSQSGNRGNCQGAGCTVYADALEEYMLDAIRERLSELPFSEENLISCGNDSGKAQKNMARKIRLTQIDEEIDHLLSKIPEAGSVLIKYIEEKVSALDTERNVLLEKTAPADTPDTKDKFHQNFRYIKAWEALSFPDRQMAADVLIKVIHIADGIMKITWNF